MSKCRSCRYWQPYELHYRDLDSEANAYCGWPDASMWRVTEGEIDPPWVHGYHWCRHYRRAWWSMTKLWVLDWWFKLVDSVKWNWSKMRTELPKRVRRTRWGIDRRTR